MRNANGNDKYKDLTMRHRQLPIISTLLAAAVWFAMATPAAQAQQLDPKVFRQRSDQPKPQPVVRQRPARKASCSEFGGGFVYVESIGSCVRAGGAINLGFGSR